MKKIKAFTLIELVVVIAIILILTFIISKTRSKIKEKSIEVTDKSLLSTIKTAVINFEQDWSKLPPNLLVLSSAKAMRSYADNYGIKMDDQYSPYFTMKESTLFYYTNSYYTTCKDGHLYNKSEHKWFDGPQWEWQTKRCKDLGYAPCKNLLKVYPYKKAVSSSFAGADEIDFPADSSGNMIYYFAYPKEYTYYPDPANPDPDTAEIRGGWFAIILKGPDGECSFDDEFNNNYYLMNIFINTSKISSNDYQILEHLNYDKDDSRNLDNIVYFSPNCPWN